MGQGFSNAWGQASSSYKVFLLGWTPRARGAVINSFKLASKKAKPYWASILMQGRLWQD